MVTIRFAAVLEAFGNLMELFGESSLAVRRNYAYPCFLLLLVFFLSNSASGQNGKAMHDDRHHQTGEEYGGAQPIAGSHLYLFAISTAGYGTAPISLLHGSTVTVDNNGNGYIVTDAVGGFDITGLYASYCPTPNSSVYLQAFGGDPGDGQNNYAIDLIAILPLSCSQMPDAPSIFISETTTVVAASALSRYASLSPLGFSAGASNPQALLDAVAYANNMVSSYDGSVRGTAYNGSLTVPASMINTIGDILVECVNGGSNSPACAQLFADATPVGGSTPADIFQAALDIALNPTNNTLALFGLVPTTGAAFQPILTTAPSSWDITYGIPADVGAQGYSLTIDHTKVANSDQIDFPILVSIPATAPLVTIANGGSVQSPSGYDILFSSDSAGQNLLDFEIDNYNPVNGSGAYWVRVPNVSHTVDTVIYMWYCIPNISNSLENALGVWSNNYLSVYHLGNGSAIGTMDSGIAGYSLSGTAIPVAGEFGGAASFSSDPNTFLYHEGVPVYPSGTNAVTLEAWAQQWSVGDAVGYGDNNATGSRIALNPSTLSVEFEGMGFAGGTLPSSGWHHVVGVYGGGQLGLASDQIYVDGSSVPIAIFGTSPAITTTELKIGGIPTVTFCCALSGAVDEVRISSGARSADWIATEYANQSSPNTFITMQPHRTVPASMGSVTTLASSSSRSQSGSTVFITATVSPIGSGYGSPTLSGQVTFYDGPTSLSAISVNSGGLATLSISTLTVGTHPITAVYSGDSFYTGSTSSVLSEVITAVFTPLISCIPKSIIMGENVTCAVALPPGASSTVNFSVNGSAWASATPDANGNAVANAPLMGAPGTYSITYNYPGDASVPVSPASGLATVTIYTAGQQPTGNQVYSFNILDPSGNTGYAPNGNVMAYNDSVNGTWSLGYDNLNRLTSSASTSAMGLVQVGCWAYDSFGNTLTQGISSQPFSDTTKCVAQSSAITLQNAQTYSAANQIIGGTWLDASKNTHTGVPSYDAAGAITNDLLNGYLYNAQGQLCAVETGPGAITEYLYNAEGQRVAKGSLPNLPNGASPSLTCDPTGMQVTAIYFIGPDGETMTEMSGTGDWVRTEVSAAGQYLATYKPDGIHYPITDWLGSKRVTVNPNLTLINGVEETCSSFPFGDQQNCNVMDASPRHYTGKERDAESGLDYFGARYYASNMGRFMSPDWNDDPRPVPYANLENPQSLNLYSYVNNNPLTKRDADGHVPCGGTSSITITVTPNGSGMSQSADDCPTMNWWDAFMWRRQNWANHWNQRIEQQQPVKMSSQPNADDDDPEKVLEAINDLLSGEIPAPSQSSQGNMQKQVEKGQAPKSVDRVDKGRGPFEKDHIEFKSGDALNKDGTWKHGGRELTNTETQWVKQNGWTPPPSK